MSKAKTAVNRARGEVLFEAGGVSYKLALTMQAMAEMEDGLGVESIAEVGEKLQGAGTTTVAIVLAALARGGGHADVTAENMRRIDVRFGVAMAAIKAAFEAGARAEQDAPEGN